MNDEQERAEFEAWARRHLGMPEHIAFNWEADWTLAALEGYRAGRSAMQSQSNHDTTLFCDLKTDEEKCAFFLSGRGYETGVIAHAIQNDVAMAYHRCAEYKKELEALQSQDREDAERYRWLRDSDGLYDLPYDDHGIGPEFPRGEALDAAIDHARRVEGE